MNYIAKKRDLAEYEAKRDFESTPEPPARKPSRSRKKADAQKTDELRFVVQEHHARALHWDLRLERDGVLVSWAVPKGIPPDPKKNHLAVHTEDHPMEYLTFSGDIPKGEYGGGSMGVWDTGTYETHKWSDREVMITFHGERVQGRYVLFQTRGNQWMIHRMDPPQDPDRAAPPANLRPMFATLAKAKPLGDGWAWELKWDGIRAIGYVDGGRIQLYTRNGNDTTHRYPELRKLGETLGALDVVLDGEIVTLDDAGRPSFERLQQRMHVDNDAQIRKYVTEVPVVYMLFDLLWHDGHSMLDRPYEERRAQLIALGLNGPSWQTPPHEVGDGASTTAISKQFELEGVVAKRLDSPYEPGKRSRNWVKVKNSLRQEFVVGGWQPGEGGRTGSIGSLLIGYYEDGALRYAGKVGSGLSGASIAELTRLFERAERDTSPFDIGKPPKGVRFVEPVLVVDVRFTEWTSTGIVRQPTYLGTRPDKEAREVVREIPE